MGRSFTDFKSSSFIRELFFLYKNLLFADFSLLLRRTFFRELANLVERMSILHPHAIIGINELPIKFRHLDNIATTEFRLEKDVEVKNASDASREKKSFAFQNYEPQSLLPLRGLDLKETLNTNRMIQIWD